MANHFFRFKQFTVYQEKCAMKVGTDGVLLGAWCSIEGKKRVLDIGTGTGLISLMIAQRNEEVIIDALEIDDDAAIQAADNFGRSPWADRLTAIRSDFMEYMPSQAIKYDLIVSNPPYFENSLKADCGKRTQARHTDTLSFEDLLLHASRLLSPEGVLSLVYPIDIDEKVQRQALLNGLICNRQTFVKGNPTANPKRVLSEFIWNPNDQNVDNPCRSELVVELDRHLYSDAYIALTRDFYLKM
ncbi:MAG: methyltransferase [Bacteroidales bacterium]